MKRGGGFFVVHSTEGSERQNLVPVAGLCVFDGGSSLKLGLGLGLQIRPVFWCVIADW